MELRVGQAAISHQVKALEARLGVELFRRLPRGLALTDEGQVLIPAITESFSRLRATLERFEKGHFRGVVSVGVVGTFATGWLLPRLDAFRETHPFVDLRLQTNNNRVDLAGEGLDFAIRYGKAPGETRRPFTSSRRHCRLSARRQLRGASRRPRTSPKKPCCAPTRLTSGRVGSPPLASRVRRSGEPCSTLPSRWLRRRRKARASASCPLPCSKGNCRLVVWSSRSTSRCRPAAIDSRCSSRRRRRRDAGVSFVDRCGGCKYSGVGYALASRGDQGAGVHAASRPLAVSMAARRSSTLAQSRCACCKFQPRVVGQPDLASLSARIE